MAANITCKKVKTKYHMHPDGKTQDKLWDSLLKKIKYESDRVPRFSYQLKWTTADRETC